MPHPHIEIKSEGVKTEVYIDGQKIPGVRSYSVRHDYEDIPVINLQILASGITFECAENPAPLVWDGETESWIKVKQPKIMI